MDRNVIAALAVGFAIGLLVGITLEASGTLERVDASIGRRLHRLQVVTQGQDDVASSPS